MHIDIKKPISFKGDRFFALEPSILSTIRR